MAEGGRASDQRVPISEQAKLTELETVKHVLDVLKEGGMDVVGFLDALCWGNLLAVTDPTVRAARTSLTHSDRLATVVSKWLDPPQTSQGGSKAGGARDTLLPLMIRTVKQIINKEMDAVIEELREDSAEVSEQTVLGTVVDEVQGKLPVVAPVFYNIIETAAWSERQEEQNSHKDPTKASFIPEFCVVILFKRTFAQRVSCIICQVAFSRNQRANRVHRPISLYLKACGTAVKAFDTMSALGVTLSQKWALTAIETVAKNKMDDLANRVKSTNFHATHDNIN